MDNILFNLAWSGALIGLAILVLSLYYSIGGRRKRISIVKPIEDHLMTTVIVIMVCGFCLYTWGYCEGNNAGNLIVMIPKAIVSSLSMFVSSSDIVDLKSDMKDDVFYMTLFTLVHFSAVLISILIILRVLGYKFTSFIKMHFRQPAEKVLVFWGINENSLMLAESIHEKEVATIVFVELPSIDKYDYNPLSGLFNKNGGIQRSSICVMEKIGAYLVRARYALHDVHQNDKCKAAESNIYAALGLNTLSRFIKNATDVQFYFLSDSEQENMDNLMDIIKFYGADHLQQMPISKIYCHARRNSLHNIIGRSSEKIQFADSSYLSVLQLLKSVDCQPANFVDIDKETAKVTSEFNALIVGFGETGCDAFNFLYEFSAFLGADGELARRTIHVMDAKLNERRTNFLNNCPALSGKQDINWWEDMTVDSQKFWNRYKEWINKLNYIIITLNDDKMASELAVKLYQTAYRYRENLNKFLISVRLKDTDSAQLLNHVSEYYRISSDRDDRGKNILSSFGTYRSLFNAEIFDTDIIDADAKRFHDQYEEICNEMYPPSTQSQPVFSAEQERHVNDDIRQNCAHQQDISNVRHIHTKLILCGVYDEQGKINKERLKYLQKIAMREGMVYNNAPQGTPAYLLMENLSLCEHLRWNAKMELLGFVPYPSSFFPKAAKKDYAYKTHHCIVSCKELNATFQSAKIYDWAVVELSLMYYGKR